MTSLIPYEGQTREPRIYVSLSSGVACLAVSQHEHGEASIVEKSFVHQDLGLSILHAKMKRRKAI